MTSRCHTVEVPTSIKELEEKTIMKRNGRERKDKMLSLVGKSRAAALDGLPSHLSKGRSRFLLKGDLVEVTQKEKGLRGSWHPAVVVEVLPGRRIVEYEELVTGNGLKLRDTVPINESRLGFTYLRAAVNTTRSKQRIRPRPPPVVSLPTESWIEGTWVDCLYEDAWWEGILKEDSAAPKTAVLVFFPDENETSEHHINKLRLTQDWDERSGTWTWRVPLLVQSDLKKQLTKVRNNREATERDGVYDFRDCSRDQPVAKKTSFVTSSPNEWEQATDESERTTLDNIDEEEENICDVGNVENESIAQATSSSTESALAQFRQMLKDGGWRISKSILQTGKIRWFYRSPGGPRYPESSKIFSTLSSALSYYTKFNIKGSGTDSTTLNSENSRQRQDKSLASTSDHINSTSCTGIDMASVLKSDDDTVSQCHLDHVDLSDGDARVYLKEMGWDVTFIVYNDGKPRWMYKAPPFTQSPAIVFHTLCGALVEYNRRTKNIAQGAGMAKATIGLLRNRQASTKSRNSTEENFISNKRLRRSAEFEEKQEGACGEEIHSESNLNDFMPATKANFLCLSNVGEMDNPDRSPADSGKRNSDDDTTFNELQLEVNINEARDYLRAAGWELRENIRKYRNDWHYKAPVFGIYLPATFQSLCGATSEYNRRVSLNNNMCVEQRPTIHLCRRNSHPRNSSPKIGEVKSACTKMDETKKKLSCGNETTTFKPRSSPRLSSKKGKRHSSEGPDFEEDIFRASSEGKISGNLLECFAAAANTTGDVKSIMGKTFGSFAGGAFEDDRSYVLQVHILNLEKKDVRIFVENDYLVIKATYCTERTNSKFSTNCSGVLRCRLTLPDDAIQESVTATQLKPGILHLIIPKRTKSLALTKFEIRIT